LWDLITSGQFTNADSASLPRSSRLLLYFGYSMLIATIALYYGTQFYADTGRPAATAFNSSLDATLGLLVLGIPLLVVTFAVRVFHGHPVQRAQPPSQ
jgi:hypothetical protein